MFLNKNWTKIFLNWMMEFQVKFCHLSGLRLWRTGMFFSTKSKDHKSNFRISGMYRYRFYDLKVQFWWPNKRSKHQVLRSNTLYSEKLGSEFRCNLSSLKFKFWTDSTKVLFNVHYTNQMAKKMLPSACILIQILVKIKMAKKMRAVICLV